MLKRVAAMQRQMMELYEQAMWMAQENYIAATDVLNDYVIFARAFCDSQHAAQLEKLELVLPAYLAQTRTLYRQAGMGVPDETYEAKAREFFELARGLWEAQQLSIEDKEHILNILLDTMKKAVAQHIGRFDKAVGLGYYEVYERLLQSKKDFDLDQYVEECRKTLLVPWKDELFMRNNAAQYYIYSRHPVEAITEEYLRNYCAQHTTMMRMKKLAEHTMGMIVDRYLELYEYLVNIYFDESVEKFSKESGHERKNLRELESRLDRLSALNARAMDVFGYYGSVATGVIGESQVYQWATKTLRLDIPFGFVKSNVLRLAQLGGLVVRKFRDGMMIIYDRSTHTVMVVIETAKNPMQLRVMLMARFKQLKSVTMNGYLMLDFDADGWVSMSDYWHSMGKLYKYLLEMDYIGSAKSLYMKAIGYLHMSAKEGSPQPATELKPVTEALRVKS